MLWRKIQNEGNYYPDTKAAHTVDKIGNKLFLFGGWNGRTALDTLECYDLSKEEWSVLNTRGDKPTPRNNHASCSYNDYIYIHGGHDGDNWLSDFYILDTKNLKWKRIITEYISPRARACHTLSRIGRKIYLYGGYDGRESFSDVDVFDMETQIWNSLAVTSRFIPSPRNSHSACVFNKKIYIYGGHFQNSHLNDLAIFDPATLQWTQPEINGTIPSGIRGHSANIIFNKIYIFGGYDGKVRRNDIYRLTLDDFTFTKFNINKENIHPRQKHTGTVTNNFKILFFGGFDGSKWLNTIDELSISILESNLSLQACQNNLKGNYKFLLNNPEYSDIILEIKGRRLYAHKSILFARCEYFRNMFSEYMLEKNTDVLPIQFFEYDVFILFLEFIYTSDISSKKSEDFTKLYELADAYAFESLKRYCEEILGLSIETETVIDLLILAYKCNSQVLENLAIDFINRNRKEMSKLGLMNKLSEYPQLMLRILENLS